MFNLYLYDMLLFAMFLHCTIIASCLQHVNMLFLLTCMPCFSPSHNLCYEVACCIDHNGLILMSMYQNLNVI